MPALDLPFDTMVLAIGLGVLFVGGVVRGFAGFGAGMIFMPVAASLFNPVTAAASFLLLDFFVTLPLVRKAWRICDWRTVLPAALASILFVHFGAYLLRTMDVLVLRWLISAIVLAALMLVASGWRYRGEPGRLVSAAVGAVAGVLGGVSQVSGPPVVAFWLSSNRPPAEIRANLIMFFFVASLGTITAYALSGFFTSAVLSFALLGAPVYAAAIFLGSRGFTEKGQGLYRRVAFALIAIAAITSLPALDGWLR